MRTRFITVSELKKKLEKADGASIVVIPGFDHSYREIGSADEIEAQQINGDFFEYEPEYGIDEPHAVVKKVFVIT